MLAINIFRKEPTDGSIVFAVDKGYVSQNPCLRKKVPGIKPVVAKIETFTDEKLDKIYAEVKRDNNRLRFLIRLALPTSIHQGEIIGLKYTDIYDGEAHMERTSTELTVTHKDGRKSFKHMLTTPKSKKWC